MQLLNDIFLFPAVIYLNAVTELFGYENIHYFGRVANVILFVFWFTTVPMVIWSANEYRKTLLRLLRWFNMAE